MVTRRKAEKSDDGVGKDGRGDTQGLVNNIERLNEGKMKDVPECSGNI